MALKRVSFTLTATAATNGEGAASVHLPIPITPPRTCFIESILFDDDAAFGIPSTFELFESDDDNREQFRLFAINGAAIPLSTQAVDTDGVATTREGVIYPRTVTNVVDETGAVLTAIPARILVRSTYLRAVMSGMQTGDVYTVIVVFETAGDMRF